MPSASSSNNSNNDPELVLECAGVLLKGATSKMTGTLCVMRDRVAWKTSNGQNEFNMSYAQIRSQRVSPAHKPKVQLQLVPVTDEPITFIFVQSEGHEMQLQQREATKDAIQNALANRAAANEAAKTNGTAESDRNRQITEKERILQNNKHLAQLYTDLVKTGAIGAKEFWSEYAQLGKEKNNGKTDDVAGSSQCSSSNQPVGVSPAFLSNIQQMDGCNNVRLNLTSEIRQQIFQTYPAVKQRHVELVPEELSEQEFWTAFFQSHYFHRDRTQNLSAKQVFAQCLKIDDNEIAKLISDGVQDPHFDLQSLRDEVDYACEEQPSSLRGSNVAKAAIIRQFNYHSARVLNTAAKGDGSSPLTNKPAENGPSSSKQAKKRTQNDDLPGPSTSKRIRRDSGTMEIIVDTSSEKFVPLTLTGASAIKRAKITNETKTTNTNKRKSTTSNSAEVVRWAQQMPQELPMVDIPSSESTLREFSSRISKTVHSAADDPAAVSTVSALYSTLTELLRHFWSCFPVTNAETKKKLERTMETIHKFEETRYNPQLAKIDYKYREHMDAMITGAINKFEAWQAGKK